MYILSDQTTKNTSMGIMDKDMIIKWILPHLTVGSRGFGPTAPLEEIVEAIFYRLKTGCQWRELPVKMFFSHSVLSWNTVYHHFNQWSKDGCWVAVWVNLLRQNLQYLDLSCASFDGSHTPAKNGGQAVGYQGRKACKTTNSLFLADNQGVILAMATPQEGQHHDLFEIQALFDGVCNLLKAAGISLDGLLLNADAGFDSDSFKQACQKENIIPNVKPNPRNQKDTEETPHENGAYVFDDLLYRQRAIIERSNAWLDAFKALLVRFEFLATNWVSFHYMAFSVIFIRKINKILKV